MLGKLRTLLGPGKQERELSTQRKELLERAERAELMAYEALAEASAARKERDEALEKIKDLKNQLDSLKMDQK